MIQLFGWLKIVIMTVLLTQHGFVVAKPMNCEDHPKDTVNVEVVQLKDSQHHHQANVVSDHHPEKGSHKTNHINGDEECEKCKAGDCICCEGGFCASPHLTAFLTQNDGIDREKIYFELILQRIANPSVGIHLLPYRPPIIG